MEISYCSLKAKDVVNISDGRNLGNITDMIIDTCCGKILGIVVPNSKNFFHIFKTNNDLFIPYNHICKIGKDIILVDIIIQDNKININSIQNQKDNQNTANNKIQENKSNKNLD